MDVINKTCDIRAEHGAADNTYGGSREGEPDYTAAIASVQQGVTRTRTKEMDDCDVFQPCVIL